MATRISLIWRASSCANAISKRLKRLLLSRLNGGCWCVIKLFYALTSIAKNTPYDLQYRFSADVDWCIRIMKKSEEEHRALRNVNAIVANFLDGGLTTANHRASLKERFRVMCHHYGCITTTFMHLWFAIRNMLKR